MVSDRNPMQEKRFIGSRKTTRYSLPSLVDSAFSKETCLEVANGPLQSGSLYAPLPPHPRTRINQGPLGPRVSPESRAHPLGMHGELCVHSGQEQAGRP